VEKYRPSSLNDLIAHQDIISTLNRLIDAQKLPHLLFYGPPGTGKTSMIIAAARRLYGKNYGSMVLEVRPCSLFVPPWGVHDQRG
jgi:replication factor C subunit 3/5